jgi:hypothetical protein
MAKHWLWFAPLFAFSAWAINKRPVGNRFHPNMIYGTDDRKDLYQVDIATARLVDSTVALVPVSSLQKHGLRSKLLTVPYGESQALCPTEPFYDQGTAPYCSGFLITPDLVITAGHCISTPEDCNRVKFIFGFALHTSLEREWDLANSEIYDCKQIVHSVSHESGEDFAVVKLDRRVENHAPLAYRQTGSPVVGQPLVMAGYPSGLPLKIAANARVRSLGAEYFLANLDSYGGNSGSAVFNADTGLVEGVLVTGDVDFVLQKGCYISNRCSNDGCRGEGVTLISRVLSYLKQ